MLPAEHDKLLMLFETEARWCRHAEARDRNGAAVQYDDPEAVAWDLTGAFCRLFGWRRTGVLLGQLERHLRGSKRPYRFGQDPVIEAMVAVQEYNDDSEIGFETVFGQLKTMPVWAGSPRPTDDSEVHFDGCASSGSLPQTLHGQNDSKKGNEAIWQDLAALSENENAN